MLLLIPSLSHAQIRWLTPSQVLTGTVDQNWLASAYAYVASSVGFVNPAIPYLAAKYQQSTTSTVKSSGTVGTPANVVWVEMGDIPDAKPVMKTKPVSVELTSAELKALSNSKPSKYPNLKAAVNSDNARIDTTTGATYYTGELIQDLTLPNTKPNGGGYWVNAHRVGSLPYNGRTMVYEDIVDPNHMESYREIAWYLGDRVVASLPVVNDILTGSSTGGTLKSAYQAEIDAMHQDPDYVPHFSDDSTGLPWTPPPGALTNTEIQNQVNKATVAENKAATDAANAQAASSAAAVTQNASNRYAASGGNPATGVGGDPALYQSYLRAKSAEDGLKAKQAEGKASEGNGDTVKNTPDNNYSPYGDSDKPQKADLKQKIKDYISGSPLVLLIRKLTISSYGGSPDMSFDYHGSLIAVDFSRYAPFLALMGNALLGLSNMYAIYIIFRKE